MRSPFRRLVRTTQSMVSQIVVSVAAAICVAVITNVYLSDGATPDATATAMPRAAQASVSSADGPLPPLDVEVIADVPEGVTPGREIFPGVPAGVRHEALQRATAGEEAKAHRRRFLGIPIPFTSTANDFADARVSGG